MAKSRAPAPKKAKSAGKKQTALKKSDARLAGPDEAVRTTDAPPKPLNRIHARQGRALIGWMTAEAAHSTIAGPGIQPPYSPEILERFERARDAVAARPPLGQLPAVLADAPSELANHVRDLESKPFYRPFLNEGWSVRVADLRHLRSLQSAILVDHADERTRDALAADLSSLATISIPTSRPKELVAIERSVDGRRWTLSCRNPHLRILGPYSADLNDGGYETKVFGFQTELSNSLVQVVRWRGVYVLRDGYHRSYGFLLRGITSIPVIYRELPDDQLPVFGPSIFDPSIYLGDRPPLLTDYLNDTVAAVIEVRRTQRTFVIQAAEMDVPLL